MRFKELKFDNREDWLKWRHAGVGASDVPIIMGVSRFKTYEQLLLEKAGDPIPEDTSNGYIKNRGNRIEDLTRKFLNNGENSFEPVNCEMVNFPFKRASLDGANTGRDIIMEIKLLSSQSPDKINKNTDGYRKWENVGSFGVIPVEYNPQVQHQLWVTGASMCVFAGVMEFKGQYRVDKDNLALAYVAPDKIYIEKMVEKICKFWYDVEVKRHELKYKGELE